ncbi:kinase-like domain-containing protein [Lentinula lateritia]|uniref:Kinase-like domain-containing protein n=1 Tax=Lentinula aff. lateritia TaxID=2804960 RepID=A0ACC1U1J0_9AGAR|nr:kinase-like domain-containing protein [Lentinula aff. lateritia]KAJ3848832.1 kinase-like domain-containing protein [Lentinula lateritia]
MSSPARKNLKPSDVDNLSDDEILNEFAKTRDELDRQNLEKGLEHDWTVLPRGTPGTVGKAVPVLSEEDESRTDSSEANALNLLWANTMIPVPRVRRVMKLEYPFFIVEDYIEGPTLAQVWSTYSLWQKIRVAFSLRSYIRQLRKLKAPPGAPPGPISNDGPRVCTCPLFGLVDLEQGPFASYAELSSFFNEKAKLSYDHHNIPDDHPWRRQKFDDSEELVLTHQDLNPRNIIVGLDGTIWMIDWGWAGYFPPWFEYVAMKVQLEHEDYYQYWDLFIPFICGPYFEHEYWHSNMAGAFYYYR